MTNTLHPPRGGLRALSLLLSLAVGLLLAPALALGQNRQASGLAAPRLYQISPTGGKQGATVEVVVAGRNLEEPEKLVFSNPAIKAELVPAPVPEIDPKTKKPKAGMAAGALPADHFKFKVTIPANAPLGNLDVRVVNKWGVSNPRVFVIGDLNEVAEKEPNNDVEQAQRIEVNSTINGTVAAATDVDYYVFKATKGQRVLVSCLASSLDSRLQPQVEIYDSKDRQVASNRNYRDYDALTDFVAPEDGEYQIRVFQFTHTFGQALPQPGLPTGASDHFYRLSVSTAPWIDAVHPPVIEAGKTTNVTVYGRNLPGGKVDPSAIADDSTLEKMTLSVTAPADGVGKLTFSGTNQPQTGWLDGFELRVKNAVGSSNPFLLGISRAPVVVEQGDNDSPEKAQKVTVPCEIAGQVEKRRDRDWYSFQAKKGEVWTIDVNSNRLGAPTYMMIQLRNPATKGSVIYESPLNESMTGYSPRFFSRSEDPPSYRFTAPADGEYNLLVASRTGDTLFGPRHSYAVRIAKEAPDFKLVAMSTSEYSPDAVNVPAGGEGSFSVLIDRDGDFAGDVELSVEGLPPGVTCAPQTLSGHVRKTTLVLTGQPTVANWAGEVKIKGKSKINGADVVREARAASIVWPKQGGDGAGTLISRMDRNIWLSVRGKALMTLTPTIDKAEIAQGDKATVKIKVNRLIPDLKQPIAISLWQPQQRQGAEVPTNLRFNNQQPTNIAAGQAEVTVPVTVANDVPPGVYNVVFRAQTQIPYSKDPMAKTRPNTPVVVTTQPLKVTVLPKSLATLSLSTTNPTVKIGNQTELVVRVNRQFKYAGEFKVQLVLPMGVTGLEAQEVTIPANVDEAKLILKVPATVANPGGRNNLLVRATATFNGKPIVHETKFNVNITK